MYISKIIFLKILHYSILDINREDCVTLLENILKNAVVLSNVLRSSTSHDNITHCMEQLMS